MDGCDGGDGAVPELGEGVGSESRIGTGDGIQVGGTGGEGTGFAGRIALQKPFLHCNFPKRTVATI